MATVIDELIVRIGLDATQFDRGQREATAAFQKTRDASAKTGKEIEAHAKTSTEAFAKLRDTAIALFAVFTGGVGLKEFVQSMTSTDAATGRLSATLGISVKTLSTYEGAWKLAGGTAQGAANAFTSMADNLQAFLNSGESKLPGFFTAFQREGKKFIDVNKPVPEIIDNIAEALANIAKVNPQRATFFAKQFPGMAELMPILAMNDGYAKFLALKKEAANYATTDKDKDAATRLLLIWDRLDIRWRRVGEMLYTSLEPALRYVGDRLLELADWATKHPKIMQVAFELITAAVVALGAAITYNLLSSVLLGGFRTLIGVVRGLATAFGLLDVAAAPWLLAAVLIAGVAVLIYENWAPISAWWKEMWAGMGKDVDDFEARYPWVKPIIEGARAVGKFLNQDIGGGTSSSGASGSWTDSTQPSTTSGSAATSGGAAPHSGAFQSNKTAAAKQAAMEQLRQEGVPEKNLESAASLLTGQAIAESGLNPNTIHDGGRGYGVYGAGGIRRTKMLQWLKDNKFAQNSLEGQMKYMAHEAMTGPNYRASRQALMQASPQNLEAGTRALTHNFESPAVENWGTRLKNSMTALSALPSLAASAQAAAASSSVWNDSHASTNTTSNETNINGGMHIHTPATDGADFAKRFGDWTRNSQKFAAANFGGN